MGKGCLLDLYCFNYGVFGMYGLKYVNWVLNKVDLVIVVGVWFDDCVIGKVLVFVLGVKVIYFDIDVVEVGKICDVEIFVVGLLKFVIVEFLW